MTRLHLVRHGRASAGWDADPDPGLDELGLEQAASLADRIAGLGARRLVSSPLRRCRETAQPLGARWDVRIEVVPDVAEIPSPEGVPMGERVAWLRDAMQGTWADLGPRYQAYRDAVVAFARSCPDDVVVVSHFIAINAVIGAAIGDDRLVIRRLDNTSVTVVDIDHGALRLVEGGHEAETLIR